MGILESAIRNFQNFFKPTQQKQEQRPILKQGTPPAGIKTNDPGFRIQFPQAQAAAPKPPPKVTQKQASEQAAFQRFVDQKNQPPSTGGGQPPPPPTREEPTRTEETRQDQGGGQQGGDRGESAEELAFRLAEEKREAAERAAQERIRRRGEIVAPIERDIEGYLSSRPDIRGLFEQELETQGVSGSRARLGGFEKDVTNLQGQLETIPTEDINRRKETGMLTAAAERRIRSMEERPIREQLLKTQGAVSSERVGLDRAYQLVDKMLDMQREQEKRGLEPITAKLESARGEFANEVDALAQRLSGFNQARTDQLAVLKQKVANDQALSLQEQKAANDLQKQEIQHLMEMEQIAARRKGQTINDVETEAKITEATVRILDKEFATANDFLEQYTGVFDNNTLQKMLKDNAVSFRNTDEGS